MIPIIIICHNNGWMVEKTINDIYNKFLTLFIIVDNASSKQRTLDILDKLSKKERILIHRFEDNQNPRRIFKEPSIYKYTKYPYIITDPDLDLSHLPDDTIKVLLTIALKYNRSKVGLALDISDKKDLLPTINKNIEIEESYWKRKIEDSNYELYDAPIDTTFCLYCNSVNSEMIGFWECNIRVAGPYAVKHLPYHKSYIDSMNEEDFNDYYKDCDKDISCMSRLIIQYKQK